MIEVKSSTGYVGREFICNNNVITPNNVENNNVITFNNIESTNNNS